MKKLLALIIFVASYINTNAQIPITIGTPSIANGTQQSSPINIWYRSHHCQIVYTASEIINAGWSSPGMIQSLGFNIVSSPANSLPNFTIKLKNTTSINAANYDSNGLTTVYSNPSYQPVSGGFDILSLSSGFLWDGTSNLLVDVCFDQVSSYDASGQVYLYTGNTDEYKYVRDDNSSQCGLSTITSDDNNKPQLQLVMQATVACSGTPVAGDATSTLSGFCINNAGFYLNLTNHIFTQGLTYQWQSSPDGVSWGNMGISQNNSNYYINSISATTYYRCVVTCTTSSQTSTSTPVTVNLNPMMGCYCTPNYTLDCSTDNISNFSLANVNSAGGCSATGYVDSTSSTVSVVNLSGGQTYTLSLTSNISGSNGDGMYGAWIDMNQNAVFDDEEYMYLGNGSSGTYSAVVNVPINITSGTARLRVMAETNLGDPTYYQEPCTNYNSSYYGVIIDYKINFIAAPLCSSAPNAGNAVATVTDVCVNDQNILTLQNNDLISGATYQWQSSYNGSNWTNIGSAQSTISYTINYQPLTTHYRCIVTCTSSALSSTSTPVVVNQKLASACYCTPEIYDCTDNQITNVILETLNDSPTCTSGTGYTDNTLLTPPSLNANQSYTISCNVNSSQGEYMLVHAWIDFNQNGVFDLAEKTVIGTTMSGILTQTINIPYTALAGTTRMRVKMEASYSTPTSVDPCESVEYAGQTIDYMVNIIPVAACSGTPNAGSAISTNTLACSSTTFTLNLSGNSIVSGITYQWQSSPDNITWTNLGTPQSTIPYIINNQMNETYYRCVLTCNTSSVSAMSIPVKVEQNIQALCHCTPIKTDCSYSGYIAKVEINTLSNTSTCSNSDGFQDYTTTPSITTTLTIGQAYTTTVTLGDQYNGNVYAWIDYDRNGSFDPSEYTYLGNPGGSPTGNYTVTNTISVPANALEGLTVMRVRNMLYSTLNSNQPCYSPVTEVDDGDIYYEDGETEDYVISLVAPDCSTLNYPPNINVTGNTSLCAGQSSTLTTMPTIGTGAGLTYQWYSNESGTWGTYGSTVTVGSAVVSPTVSSNYYVDILCHGTSMLTSDTIVVNYHPINTNISSTTSSCFGLCNGTVTLNATSPGSPSLNYTWMPNVSNGDAASGLCAGDYSITIANSFGCSTTITYTLTQPTQLVASISGNTLTCLNSTATYSSNVTGGTTPYSYVWANLTNTVASTNVNYDYTANNTGNDSVWLTVTDLNGCVVQSNTVALLIPSSTNISGTVTTNPSLPVAGRVVLYKYLPFYTKFDSVAGQNMGPNGEYNFVSFNSGTYIVKAIPSSSSLQIAYGDSALMWKDAKQINHDCISNDIQNITVKALATFSVSGSGTLSGTIYEGQGYGQRVDNVNQTAAPGQPIGGIIVKGGRNPGGQMFVQTTTNTNGTYTLSGFPDNSFGESYFVMVDVPGLDTNGTYHRVITITDNNFTNLDFIIDSAKVNPVSSVGVQTLSMLDNSINIFPNPTNGVINIQYSLSHTSLVSIELFDMLGKSVKTLMPSVSQSASTYKKYWYLDDVRNGLYFIKVNINGKENVTKISITD